MAGERTPGVRVRSGPDPFDAFVDYVVAWLTDDPHLWARTLYDAFSIFSAYGRATTTTSLPRTYVFTNALPSGSQVKASNPLTRTASSEVHIGRTVVNSNLVELVSPNSREHMAC